MLAAMTRKILLCLAALGALGLIAVLAVPFLIPTDALRGQIESRISRATGRDFRIHGPLSFSVFPNLGLDARQVTLAGAPGGRDLLALDEMHISVRLAPLFSGKIEATEITLDHPRIALAVDAAGHGNWTLTRADRASAQRLAVPAGALFQGVVISGGSVSYDNARLNLHRRIDDLDATVTLTRIDQPADVGGAVTYMMRRVNYTANVTTLETLLRGEPTHTRLALDAPFLHATFQGDVSKDGTIAGAGTLHTPSLKDLALWLGHPISAGAGLGPLDARADIRAKDQNIALSRIVARLDAMRVTGALRADLTGRTPHVDGHVAIDKLDLNTYLRLDGTPPPQAGAPSIAAPAPSPQPAPSGPAADGWSKNPIQLALVKLIDGHLMIDAGSLAVRHLKLGRGTLDVKLADGLMTAHMAPLQLYGGTGDARLTVDARGGVPQFANTLTFANIAMGPFLADALGVNKVVGTGTLTLDVTSKGVSPDALMRALSGKGEVAVVRGSIHGVDMGAVARTVETLLSAGATGDGAVTAFDRFGGSFVIANGILMNNDLTLAGDYVNMTGRGKLDLGNQTIAYRIEPKASVGGKMHLLDVGVPFAITGSWAHLTYQADIAGAISNFVGDLIGAGVAPVTGLWNGLTGPAPDPKQKKPKSPTDTVKGFFGMP
jgi:AsmA protein